MAFGPDYVKDVLLKVVIIGESGVGKTCLLCKYVENVFLEEHKATIGCNFMTKEIMLGNEKISLQIWDTAGQERYNSICHSLYRGADACIFVYELGDNQSFAKIPFWRKQFIEYANIDKIDDFPFALLGNKADLEREDGPYFVDATTDKNMQILVEGYCNKVCRKWSIYIPNDVMKLCEMYYGMVIESGAKYAEINEMLYFEVSALNGLNVEDAFRMLAGWASEMDRAVALPAMNVNQAYEFPDDENVSASCALSNC